MLCFHLEDYTAEIKINRLELGPLYDTGAGEVPFISL